MYDQIVVLGVVASILFSELTGLSPAGLIVPGYIALTLHSPQRILYTLAVALLAMLACRVLNRYVILYGRRQFAATILAAFLIDALITQLHLLPWSVGMIGCLVPAIIARELDRQGIVKTVLSLGTVTCFVVLVVFLLGWQGLAL